MSNTSISWCINADKTKGKVWNPLTGCMPAGEGCKHCYAARLHNTRHKAYRAGKLQNHPQYAKPFSEIQLHPERLVMPMRWKKQQTVFVNSMSDLFHRLVTLEFVARVLGTIRDCPWHTFIVLTKRAERMRDLLVKFEELPLHNLALGVSCSTQTEVDRLLEQLRQTPCACPGISLEPLIESVTLGDNLTWLKWVIVGGESGPNARPMHPDWARSIRDECAAAGVSFYLKQNGEWAPGEVVGPNGRYPHKIYFNGEWDKCSDDWITEEDHGPILYRCGLKKAGRTLDGRTHDALPWRIVNGPH